MTLLILLLDDCLFLLTVFPGIVLTIEEFVPFVRRMGAVYEYAIGLLLIVMADSIYLHDAEVCLAFLAALAGSFLVLAPALVKSGGWRSVKDAWKRAYRHIFFDVVSSIRGGDLPIVHISIRLSAMRHSSSMGLFRSIFFWFSLCAFCHSKASGSSFSAIVCASRISICHDQEPVPGHPCACFLQRLRLFPTTSAFIRPIDALLRAAAFQTNCKLSIACQ